MIGIVHEVYPIRKIGREDDIVAIEMLNHTVPLQCHDPAGVLMHAVINNEKGMATAQRRFY